MLSALLAAALYSSRMAAQAVPSHAIALVALEMYNKSPYVSLEVARSSRRLLFLLNPGSAPTYLDQAAAAKLGLTPYAETAPGDSQPRQFVDSPGLAVEGVTVPVARLRVVDLSGDFPAGGISFDGIIGADLFTRYVVEIDHEVGLLRLYQPADFHYYGAGVALPLAIIDSRPYVRAALRVKGRTATHQYRIDFGTGDAINDDLFKLLAGPGQALPDLGRAEVFEIAGVQFSGVNGTVGGPLVGGELLHRFNITFDYAHHRIYLEPNRHVRDAFVFDMSGLSYTLTRDLHAIAIERVVDGTPGATAGLRAGDTITAIDSTPVATLGLDTVLRIFEEPHAYELTVSRGPTIFHALLLLRKLL
jgi:PDZ domain-containing protein